MGMRAGALVCGVLWVGLVVVGCGGGGEDGLEKTAFVKQANAACAKSAKKARAQLLDAYGRQAVKKSSTEREAIALEVSVFTPILIEEAESQLESIQSLGQPSEGEAEVEKILAAYEGWIEKAKAAPFKVVVANDIYNHARELGGEYGLETCARSAFEEAQA